MLFVVLVCVVRCSLFHAGCVLFVSCCVLFVVNYALLAAVCCLLVFAFVVNCPLIVVG